MKRQTQIKCRKKPRRPQRSEPQNKSDMTNEEAFEPVWDVGCEVCGASPIVRATGLCGPCTFGEAETINGNW